MNITSLKVIYFLRWYPTTILSGKLPEILVVGYRHRFTCKL